MRYIYIIIGILIIGAIMFGDLYVSELSGKISNLQKQVYSLDQDQNQNSILLRSINAQSGEAPSVNFPNYNCTGTNTDMTAGASFDIALTCTPEK